MHDFIFILGAQGSGKTTLARILKEKLNSVHIDYDWIRDFHLDKNWKNANDAEGKMSLENLVFLLKNYAKHNYKDVIVTGFIEKDFKIILNELRITRVLLLRLFSVMMTYSNKESLQNQETAVFEILGNLFSSIKG